MASRIVFNRAELARLFTSPAGPTVRMVTGVCRRTQGVARVRAPKRTGKGAASITFAVAVVGNRVVGRVGTPLDYMGYQHRGTGIYGPMRRPIVPVHAKALKFKVKGQFGPVRATKGGKAGRRRGAVVVFAASARGVPPNPFLVSALEDVSPWPVVRTMG